MTHAAVMAATQRPATQEALVGPSGEHPLWKHVPSWFLVGDEDRIILAALQRYIPARPRAEDGRVEGASHAIAISRPDATVHPILEAAELPMAA
jgi:pimeloyl-ACP methyl ester carboxylesterase